MPGSNTHYLQCYWLRTGDTWTPIDYKKDASHWMTPLKAGEVTGLCEIPASWVSVIFSFSFGDPTKLLC